MAKFWCKVCDEPLRVAEGAFVTTCTVCGARQALPHPIDDEYLLHYGELKRLRQNQDFEHARLLVDGLLTRAEEDPALYWQRVLIDYEAVYRRDENEREYELECLREEHMPVMEHADYQSALRFSSPAQRGIYEEEAKLLEHARRIKCGETYTPDSEVSPLNSGFLCLEDGEWDAANERFDCALEENPEDALAYFGKMMAELHVHRESELAYVGAKLPETENHRHVLQYGDDSLRERLSRYWENGLLAQAVAECEHAQTVDDWKRIKKLLQQIQNNAQARENMMLCDKKIREIMVNEAQVVMGCREAANLGLTTETLGVRMVNANYYYDFDAADSAQGPQRSRDFAAGVAITSLVVLGLLAIVLVFFFLLRKDDSGKTSGIIQQTGDLPISTETDFSRTVEGTTTTAIVKNAPYIPELCVVGERVFAITADGNVQCYTGSAALQTTQTDVSGASFAGNVAPYASDWSTWEEVAVLESDPTGEMLFAVMKNGTIAYDIFSSSQMKYEEQYRTVSGWIGVTSLFWDDADPEQVCLFALKKDGTLYASNAETNALVQDALAPFADKFKVVNAYAENHRLHLIFNSGSYLYIDY